MTLAARHRNAADEERIDVEQRSKAAGSGLQGRLVSNPTGAGNFRAEYSWTHQEADRRRDIKALEQRLHNLGADE